MTGRSFAAASPASGIAAEVARVKAQRDALREALEDARETIQADRDAMFDCHTVGGDPDTLDEDGGLAVDGYDVVLASIDAALAATAPRVTTEGRDG